MGPPPACHPALVRQPRWAAVSGIAGPTAFVAAWATGGALTPGYSPFRDTISRLAEEGASTAPLMTAGFVAFGVLLPIWGRALGERLGSPVLSRVVTVAGVATLGVAAAPLTRDGGSTRDTLHAIAAGTGYLAMAATPLLAARPLRRAGHGRAATASAAVGVTSAAALVASVLAANDAFVSGGGWQRLGLTVVDAWHVVMAGAVLRARLTPSDTSPSTT